MLGEPRATVDINLAIVLREASIPALVGALEPVFFVDPDAVRRAVRHATSVNVLHRETMLKVDLFVLGDSAFDAPEARLVSRGRWRRRQARASRPSALGVGDLLDRALEESGPG